jgi:hypothetical protein
MPHDRYVAGVLCMVTILEIDAIGVSHCDYHDLHIIICAGNQWGALEVMGPTVSLLHRYLTTFSVKTFSIVLLKPQT